MPNPSLLAGNFHVAGLLSMTSLSIPPLTLIDTGVNGAADIAASKLEHQHRILYAQESATDASDEARVLHAVYGTTGTVLEFECGVVVAAAGAATVDVDLLKNGVSILTAAIEINAATVIYTPKTGTIDTAALVDGDVLEVSIDETIGGGTRPKGVWASLTLTEKAV